jgi:hypothetical protein
VKPPSSILGCCLAALPLIGCVEPFSAHQGQTPAPTVAALASPIERVYATDTGAPAAILVFVPATSVGGGDLLTRDPALWAAHGFDVVMPQTLTTTRLIADREAALERLLASARALAGAPIWLIGPRPEIEAAMPRVPPGQVSGVPVTSVTSTAGSCSRTVVYSNPGGGAEPRVPVSTSGDACGMPSSIGEHAVPSGVLPLPHAQPTAPRIIQTSIPDHTPPGAQQRLIRHVAEEIKGLPSS